MKSIIELAKQAGPLITTPFDQWCENFAALVRAQVLEEAALVCEEVCDDPHVVLHVGTVCAAAIRQLKDKT